MENGQNWNTSLTSSNTQKTLPMKKRHFLKIIIGVLIIFCMGCSKEKIDIRDIPFSELQSSYYVLSDRTIEIPDDRYNELVIKKDKDVLILKEDPLFSDVKEGINIVSKLTVTKERILFREITSVSREGGMIIATTNPANIVKAFKEYYFNSEFSNLIQARADYDIKTIFETADNVVNLLSQALIPIPFDPDFIMTGKPEFEAIHPNTAYKYFGCDDPPNCLNYIDTTMIDPVTGYYQEVKNFFPNLDQNINKNGLFTFTLKDFGIEKMSATVDIGQLLQDGYPNGNPKEVFEAFANQQVDNVGAFLPTDLHLKYFPIATLFGIINFAAVIGPEFGGFANSAAAHIEINANFPNKADLRIGHLNWNNPSSPNFDFDLKLIKKKSNQQEEIVDLSYLIQNPSINSTMGAKGEVEYTFGLGVGAALAVGEPNYAGTAVGALVDIASYINFNGHIGINFTDILTKGGGSIDFFGNICTDIGIKFGAKFFFDENIIGDAFEEFFVLDVVLPIPEFLLPLNKFSFLQYLPDYKENGICYGSDGCKASSQVFFNISPVDNELVLKFKYKNNKIPNEKYTITLKTENQEFPLNGEFEFGKQIGTTAPSGQLEILEAYAEGKLKIVLSVPSLSCSFSFNQTEIGLYFDCLNLLYETPEPSTHFVEFVNISQKSQYYFLNSDASVHCQSKGKTIMSKNEIIEALKSSDCINPSGYLIPNDNAFLKINSHQLYIWIPEQANGDNILEINLSPTPMGNNIKSSKTHKSSQSIYAPCLCK